MPKRKLTADQVKAIRNNRNGLTYRQLAQKYGVHRNTIALARSGATWGKVY